MCFVVYAIVNVFRYLESVLEYLSIQKKTTITKKSLRDSSPRFVCLHNGYVSCYGSYRYYGEQTAGSRARTLRIHTSSGVTSPVVSEIRYFLLLLFFVVDSHTQKRRTSNEKNNQNPHAREINCVVCLLFFFRRCVCHRRRPTVRRLPA